MWTGRRSSKARAVAVPRPAGMGVRSQSSSELARRVVRGRSPQESVLVAKDHAVFGAAQPCGGRYKSVEHRLEIECRAADDLQHLGGRGLLVQCLGQLARTLLLRIEQAHVLDCDHRLIGEGLQQSDLGVGKWSDVHTRNGDCSNGLPSCSIGTASMLRYSPPGRERDQSAVAGIDEHIRNMAMARRKIARPEPFPRQH